MPWCRSTSREVLDEVMQLHQALSMFMIMYKLKFINGIKYSTTLMVFLIILLQYNQVLKVRKFNKKRSKRTVKRLYVCAHA